MKKVEVARPLLTKAEAPQYSRLPFDGTKKAAEKLVAFCQLPSFKRKYRVSYFGSGTNDWVVEVSGVTSTVRGTHRVHKGDVLLGSENFALLHVERPVLSTYEESKREKTVEELGLHTPSEAQMRYVNAVAPEHCRSSCGGDDGNLNNAWYGKDDTLWGRCTRCTLLQAVRGYAKQEDEDE